MAPKTDIRWLPSALLATPPPKPISVTPRSANTQAVIKYFPFAATAEPI